jgi:hypothetical protein
MGCGGGDDACTTLACTSAQAANQPRAQGGSGGASSNSGTPGGDLLSDEDPRPVAGLQDDQVCNGVTVNAPTRPINVLILLDRSISMLQPTDPTVVGSPSRWDAVRSALGSFVNSDQATEARVGLQFLGLMRQDDCSVDKYAVPAVAVAPLAANRAALLDIMNTTLPGSLTPTAPAVEGSLRYALSLAQRPENADVPTVLVLASDGLPTECGTVGADGVNAASVSQVSAILKNYAKPPLDGAGKPTQPPIRTYVVAPEGESLNARTLAQAGDAQAFVLGTQTGGGGANLEAEFLDALLRIIAKPLDCQIDLPQLASGTGQSLDFDKVRVRFTAANSGTVTEYPRTDNVVNCGNNKAWYYDDPLAPKKIIFCQDTCQALSAGDLKVELGCSPTRIVR